MTDYVLHAGIVDEALDRCNAEIRPYPAYSGRGMRGEACFGIVSHDARGLIEFVLAVTEVLADESLSDPSGITDRIRDLREAILPVRSDSLGSDTIWYWPHVTLADPDSLAERE